LPEWFFSAQVTHAGLNRRRKRVVRRPGLRLGGLALGAPLHRRPRPVEHRQRAGAAGRLLVAEVAPRPGGSAAGRGRRFAAEVAAVALVAEVAAVSFAAGGGRRGGRG
jgi:hypothetical protein